MRCRVQVEVIVDSGAVEFALPERGELHRLGHRGGIRGGTDQRNHQSRGAVFEQVVEIGGVAAAGSDDAVDVGEVMQADESLASAPRLNMRSGPASFDWWVSGAKHGRTLSSAE